jgi:hypothetical protein
MAAPVLTLGTPGSSARKRVAVPSVIDDPVDTAQLKIIGLGLNVRVENVVGAGNKDTVNNQRPAPRATLAPGGVVTIEVITAPPPTSPDILAVLNDLKTDIAAVNTSVTTINADVSAVKTEVATIKTDVATIKNKLPLKQP